MNRRIPALDNLTPSGWLSATEVLLEKNVRPETPSQQFQVYNLVTETLSALAPALPALPRDTAAERYGRTPPTLSPNGQWLLYLESIWSPKDSGERWRLISRDGKETRFVPSDGAYHPIHPSFVPPAYKTHLDFYWLPDSSGWVTRRFQASGKIAFSRYGLTSPDLSPQPLPVPNSVRSWLDSTSSSPRPVWMGMTQQGHPLFASSYASDLIVLDTTERKIRLKYPRGYSFAALPHICGEFFVADGPQLVQGNTSLLALLHRLSLREKIKRIQAGDWAAIDRVPVELWLLPLNGGAPEKLVTLPPENYFSHYSLAPGGKSLLYWEGQKATLLTWK